MAKIVTGGAFAIAIPDEDYATKETLEKLAEEAAASAEEASGAAEEATAAASEATGAAAEATGAAAEASGSAIGAGISALRQRHRLWGQQVLRVVPLPRLQMPSLLPRDASDSEKAAGKSATDAQKALNTLLTTPVTLTGDVQGSGLLSAPIPTAFKEKPCFAW
ncbi:unnamed protein product [Sphagnum jensenii]|uniref:Uncharacterized protein n=1 Tax=Sphagnum jensenii TaxID=128206 RepID=A0ABP0VJ23_9BRYO